MAGLYDGLQEASGTVGAEPGAPAVPKSMYDGLEMAPTVQQGAVQTTPREASGAIESLQAGLQGSAPGLAWRGKLPDLVINPEHASWWERALSGIAHVGAELPLMIGGAIAGAPAGAALGTAVAPGAGTAVGSLLGAGAGMGAVPAAIRQTLIEAYKSGEVMTAADFWNSLREVAKTTAMEAGLNAAAMGAGAMAGRVVGKAIAPSIGKTISVPTAMRTIEAADLATQIAAMPTIPAAFQGRMPDAQEFLDAAILIGGLKAAHVTAKNITNVFIRTGKTPAEQVQDAQKNPEVAHDLSTSDVRTSEPDYVPPTRMEMLRIQENLFAETARLNELEAKAQAAPLTDAERLDFNAMKARVLDLERQIQTGAPELARTPTYTADQFLEARKLAEARSLELTTKADTGQLTDAERAERVFLNNSMEKPDALAMHFDLEPQIVVRPTPEQMDASAQKIHDDVLRQVRDADEARRASGLEPLGDDHAQAVAALVRARMRTRAERLGMLPEDLYNERPTKIIDETAPEVAAAEAAIPEDAPRFTPPEVDLFGNPVVATNAPRFAVENLTTVEVPLANLILSKEVPQFKKDANQAGVIVPLGGTFDRTGVGPIQVWERLNGQLEVISGRHRLDLARRSGEETIPAQIHREADGFDARQAAVLDAELNIREEQGSVADYVQYFKTSGKTREAADELGLLARAKGKAGFAVARDGSDDLISAHRAGQLSDEAALSISSTAPGSARLQALGIAMVNEGKSILIAVNTMRAVDLMAAERMMAGTQGDIFGFDDSALREASAMAKKASSKQRQISEQVAAVSGASKRPELARKMGVNVEDPAAVQAKILELKQEQYLWDNWPLYPELVAKLRSETLKQQPIEPNGIDEIKSVLDRYDEGEEYMTERDLVDEIEGVLDSQNFPGDVSVLENAVRRYKEALREDFEELAGRGDMDNEAQIFEETLRRYMADQETLKQGLVDEFPLKPETPAEATARDQEAAAEAMRKAAREQVTSTPEFRAWFGKSKVVDKSGAPAVVYHGTTDSFDAFDLDHPNRHDTGWLGNGVYATDLPALANSYANLKRGGTENVMPLYAKLENPYYAKQADKERIMLISHNKGAEAGREASKAFTEELQAKGHDGVILQYTADMVGKTNASREVVVFDTAAVKSAIGNRGTFDPNNTNILFQDIRNKWYRSALGEAISTANIKSAPAKGWLDMLKGQVAKGGVKADEIKWSGVEDWLKLQEGKVTKEQVADYLASNGVKVEEVMLGGYGNRTPRDQAVAGDVEMLKAAGWKLDTNPDDPGRYMFVDPDTKDFISAGEIRQFAEEQTIPGPNGTMMPNTEFAPIPPDVVAAAERVERYLNAGTEGVRPTRFGAPDLVLPGGENYRELLLTLPIKNDGPPVSLEDVQAGRARLPRTIGPEFQSSHFDQPNILAHIRFNERTDAEGKKVLFVEEIQSDWAQKGKKEGFAAPAEIEHVTEYQWSGIAQMDLGVKPGDPAWVVKNNQGRVIGTFISEAHAKEAASEYDRLHNGVPAAPFVGKTDAWVSLALKRMIRYAAENGFDKVAWTRGEQQVERYSSALRKAVDVIEWKKTPEGVQLVGYKGSGPDFGNRARVQNELASVDRQIAEAMGDGSYQSLPDNVQTVVDALESRRVELLRQQRDMQAERTKVVDTTESESALSDAIGKSMADRIRNDPNQTGTIEGDQITVSDTGMAGFYDKIVPKVAKEVLKKLGGGKVTETEIELPVKQLDRLEIAPVEGPPQFSRASAYDRTEMGGLDDFPNGDVALIAESRIKINDSEQDVIVTVDPQGVHVLGENFELIRPLPRNTEISAARAEEYMRLTGWENPAFWASMELLNGELPGQRTTNISQPAFDITPAMREGAMAGQPLFQKQADQLHRGSYDIAENLVTIMQGADKSTVVHELGHSWLEEMKADAARPDAPEQIKADWETLRKELAIGKDGEIDRSSHEQFARSVERYLAEGKAPSVELRGVFERFRDWLLAIYKDLRNLNVTINPELRTVLDRMLATDQEIADAKELGVPRAYVDEARAVEAAKIVPPPEARRKIEPGFAAEKASMEPYADELPPGPGEAPDNIHVNYQYINSPMDVKLAMQRMAEIDQANIQKQRGGTNGVKSWAEANAEQAKYVNDILNGTEDTLRLLQPRDPNAAGPDVKLGVLKKLAVGAAEDAARMRDIVLQAGHDATIRQQLEYLGSIERARMIQAEFLGERAGVARALNALKDTTAGTGEIGRMLEAIGVGDAGKLFQDRTPAEEQAYLKAKLDEILLNYRGKTVLDIAKLHKEIGTLKGTFKMAEGLEKATKWEMVVEAWRAGLLSGPVTHTTNLFGTAAFHAMRPAVDALSAIIGMARGASPGIGESDRASMSEAVSRIAGMLGAVQDGVKVAVATFKLDDPTGKTEAYRTAIPGRAGELIRIPLRMMGAEDALVTTMYQRGELRTLAIRTAFNEQLTPNTREFAERVQALIDHPTEEMKVAAETAATRMTFNAPLGEKGVALQGFVNKWNLQWVIPFIRTPINIAKELLRMSPFAPAIGEWRAAIAKGGVERDRALAEMTLGSGIMALTAAYAFAGNISGAGSPDPGKNRGKAGVWQPYSILIGDTWYEYSRIQPTGTLMGMAADMAAVWDHMSDEEKNIVPRMLATAFAQAITNQTFLQGITNVVNATSDPTRFGPRFLQQMAGSMVPNIIGQPTTMADPVVREVHSMLEAIQARIPGMRQNLIPKRDWLGEPSETRARVGVILPSRTLDVSTDKVRLEAARLDISMAAPPKKTHFGKGTGKIGNVEFTPEEQDKFEQISGQFVHPILDNIVNAPGYDAMPDMIKQRIFREVITAGRRVAAVQALPQDKRMAYLQSITEKITAELQPGDSP